MMTTISQRALDLLTESNRAKLKLAYHFDKTYNTILNWIKNEDQMLTTPDAVRIISEELGLQVEDILTSTVAA